MKLYDTLEKQLKKEPNYTNDNGELKKWVVINKAQNYDIELISLLLDDKETKNKFFLDIKGILVFNQALFIQFLEQKNYLNDSFTEYKNKLGLNIDGKYLKQRNEVSLVWPFKDCILEGGQSHEEDKREEIFFNETLAQDEINQLLEPKVLTNAKHFSSLGEKPFLNFNRNSQGVITDNLIIKGNNLLALHSIKKEFSGKVKLIYIDPPYNTGSDGFKYNDNFNHSTWLTFMKNRLEIAKELLTKDGFIFVQIDDDEQAYLKVLMDEIFDRENFNTTICVKMSHLSGVKMAHKEKKLPKIKEHILMYSRNRNLVKLNPEYIQVSWDEAFSRYTSFVDKGGYPDHECAKWKVISVNQAMTNAGIDLKNATSVYDFKMKNADLIFRTSVNRNADYSAYPKNKFSKIQKNEDEYYFIYNHEDINFTSYKIRNIAGKAVPTSIVGDIWTDIGINNLSNEGGVSLRFGKKPEKLIARIINMTTNIGDIVLDFHLGSGTTAAVAHKLKRQYIGIEQLDYKDNDSVRRLVNVIKGENIGLGSILDWKGGGNFTYVELKKHNELFISQIQEAKDTATILGIWENMKENSYLNYNIDIQKQEAHIEEFKTLDLKDQKIHLVSLLNKNQLYVNLSSLYDGDFDISEDDRKISTEFYQLKSK
jgi:adenine-specific DNA-methyltransferase